MTIIVLVQVFLTFAVLSQWVYFDHKVDKLQKQNINLARNYKALEELIERVDDSVSRDVWNVRKELNVFKEDFGEAAIEEKRQAAKAEKAWADGVNSIMSYGTQLQGGGNSR